MNQGRSRRRSWSSKARLLVPLLFVTLASCANSPQDSLKPAGEWSRKIDRLFNASFIIAVVIFFVVEGLLVFALFRFRARPGNENPKQIHGSTPLEIGWTIVPALILAVLAVPTVATVFQLYEKPADAVQLTVTGHQWWWEFQYPKLGVVTANELHIPAGKQIEVSLRSHDVIHSFWVPQLAGKVDVVPGHKNHLVIEADKPGLYLGQCAEFCGLSHANMRFRVIAQTQREFDQWVDHMRQEAVKPSGGAALQGFTLWGEKGCAGCHTIDGHPKSGGARVGPNLTHLQDRSVFAGAIFDLTPANLKKWLADPPGMKPMQPQDGIGMPNLGLSPDEIDNLVAYLETLK